MSEDAMELDDTVSTNPIYENKLVLKKIGDSRWEWIPKKRKKVENPREMEDLQNEERHSKKQKNDTFNNHNPSLEDSGISSSTQENICHEQLETGSDHQIKQEYPSKSAIFLNFWIPPDLELDKQYFILRKNKWILAKLIKIISDNRFCFTYRVSKDTIIVTTDHFYIAINEVPKKLINLQHRVIAKSKRIVETGEFKYKRLFELGIVAEYPTKENNRRYLIIFDKGYWFYVKPAMVRPLYFTRFHFWRDIPSPTRKMVRDYFRMAYIPMKLFYQSQNVIITIDGKEHFGTVATTDASLILVNFADGRAPEWFYRGMPWIKSYDTDENITDCTFQRSRISTKQSDQIPQIISI